MAVPFTSSTGSASIGSSEVSLISGTTTLQASTTAGDVEAWIDLSNMTFGDTYQVRVVEKVNGGTAANAYIFFPKDVQVGLRRVGPLRVGEGWDVRLKLTAGSARTVNWSLRQYVGDVNTASIASGAITATAIASSAITSAKFATDAVDSNALASSAVTEIQTGLATSTALASVQSDTDDIQSRLPTALDGNGNIKAGVQSIASGAITATSIAAAAITSAKFATDAIDSNALSTSAVTEIQTGLATSTALSSVQADTDDIQTRLPTALDGNGNIKAGVQTIVAGAVTASSIASSAITAAKFATDAIDSNAFATSAVTEIQTGLATSTALANVQADTDDIQSRLPAALDLSGNIKSGVQSIVTGAITATSIASSAITAAKFATDAIDSNALAATAVTEIQAGLATSSALSSVQSDTDDIQSRLPSALDGNGNIKAGVQTISTGAITASSIAAAAITAAKFSTDAIDSNALAASAVSEIQSGLATSSAVSSIQSDTDDIQSRLPATLDGSGNIKAAVQSIVSGAVTSIQSGLATSSALSAVQSDTDDIQSRLPLALDIDGNIKAGVQSIVESVVTTIQSGLATSGSVAGVQTDTTTLTGRLTSTRAGLLDNLSHLNVDVNTLATAISLASVSTQITGVQSDTDDIQTRLPTALDGSGNIKAAVQSVVGSVVTAIQSGLATSSAVASIQSDTDDIQTRLPISLDGGGNIKASVQSITNSAVSSITDAIGNYTIEAAPVNATTRIQRERVIWSILCSIAHGLGISTPTTEEFLSADGSKPRATFGLDPGTGTRTPGEFDGTP
jgi:hypothetical protein